MSVPLFYRHHYLIAQLVRRDVLLKYRGSFLGITWSFLYPLLLLAAFTLVFGSVIGTKWSTKGSGVDLALFIYCGLLVFTPFAEVAGATPRLLQSYQAYVKKIIFPTEILPLVSLMSATVHGLVNLVVLVLFAILAGHIHIMLLLVPLILLPAWLFILGMAWFLAAAGAYVRDLVHVMPVVTQLTMFLSPVFYPVEVAPALLRQIHFANPLAVAMQDTRRAVLDGLPPQWGTWLAMLVIGLAVAILGYKFFQRGKEEYADVL
jgi:ABC-type polysaccharide/polyol phosphate export systems, permease component